MAPTPKRSENNKHGVLLQKGKVKLGMTEGKRYAKASRWSMHTSRMACGEESVHVSRGDGIEENEEREAARCRGFKAK